MNGLTSSEAAARLAAVGPNALQAKTPRAQWRRFLDQFASPLVYILLFALMFDLGLWIYEDAAGWPVEAVAIAGILCLNASLGLLQERRSEAALARLAAMAAAQAWVLRDGRLTRVPSVEVVPGDWVRLEAGDRVPADGRLDDAQGAMLDESMLTGESVPVDRTSGGEAFSGTLLVRGRTYLDVTSTGAESAMGRLAGMLGDITPAPTPLERRVDELGRHIARWVLMLAAGLAVAGTAAEGLARGPDMLIFAVALAVAAVPEGLPAVLTVTLARGVERMARRKAVVRRLAAVEALGSVTVIATDKTGTLTENQMEVRGLDSPDEDRALKALVLASDADLATGAGDPLELGLLRYASSRELDLEAVRAAHPVVSARAFDSAWKFARVTVHESGHPVSYIKGAPEVLIGRSTLSAEDRQAWSEKAIGRAREGNRVLGLACGEGAREEDLTFLGLVALWDPPRAEVPAAIKTAQAAGIRVVMITGDHPETAAAIAHQVGVRSAMVVTGDDLDAWAGSGFDDATQRAHVFARVRPDQKLHLVEALQARGEIVAMTGDGVNDAPALKRSDVGVAMGQRGSDVSREVADLVLLDDNFATIVGAVEEGRGIYHNIQAFVRFLFSTNLSEVLLVAGGAVMAFSLDLRDDAGQLLLPLTAAQILWINLVTDGLPALALAFDRTPGLMTQPPRPARAPLLDRPSLQFIIGAGSAKALLALGVLGGLSSLGYDFATARATTFHFMAIGQLFLTYPARHTNALPVRNNYLHAAVGGGVALQLATANLPTMNVLLGTAPLPAELWAVVFVATGLSWLLAETSARVAWRLASLR